MIDPDCERKRFVETLEDPRAVTALVGVVVAIFPMVWYGMVWYGMVWLWLLLFLLRIRARKPAARQ